MAKEEKTLSEQDKYKRILKNGGIHDGKECTITMCYSMNPKIKDKCLGWCIKVKTK